jgi:excisionase family DNA binding protein
MVDLFLQSQSKGAKIAVDKLLVSRREAATRLSISQRAIGYLIANKTLAAKRIGSRMLISTRDLKRFSQGDHPERLAS